MSTNPTNEGRGIVYLGSFNHKRKAMVVFLRTPPRTCPNGPQITVPLDQLKKQPKR